MLEVSLERNSPSRSSPVCRVFLRELEGEDELLDLTSSDSLAHLLGRLLVRVEGFSSPPPLNELSLSDLDRIAARLYASLYGDGIECSARCPACNQDFSVSFSLQGLWEFVNEQSAEHAQAVGSVEGPDSAGVYTLLDGSKFRLPTQADLAQTHGLALADAVSAVTARCVLLRANGEQTPIDRAMSLLGPRLDVDIDVNCASCEQAQRVNFNIEQFLRAALHRERALVLGEIHVLAKAYRWGRSEILAMSRTDRRFHVELVLSERERAWVRS